MNGMGVVKYVMSLASTSGHQAHPVVYSLTPPRASGGVDLSFAPTRGNKMQTRKRTGTTMNLAKPKVIMITKRKETATQRKRRLKKAKDWREARKAQKIQEEKNRLDAMRFQEDVDPLGLIEMTGLGNEEHHGLIKIEEERKKIKREDFDDSNIKSVQKTALASKPQTITSENQGSVNFMAGPSQGTRHTLLNIALPFQDPLGGSTDPLPPTRANKMQTRKRTDTTTTMAKPKVIMITKRKETATQRKRRLKKAKDRREARKAQKIQEEQNRLDAIRFQEDVDPLGLMEMTGLGNEEYHGSIKIEEERKKIKREDSDDSNIKSEQKTALAFKTQIITSENRGSVNFLAGPSQGTRHTLLNIALPFQDPLGREMMGLGNWEHHAFIKLDEERSVTTVVKIEREDSDDSNMKLEPEMALEFGTQTNASQNQGSVNITAGPPQADNLNENQIIKIKQEYDCEEKQELEGTPVAQQCCFNQVFITKKNI